jgi:hypothetical protein
MGLTRKKIIANNVNLSDLIEYELNRFGNAADLNHIDVSNVTNMDELFSLSPFNGEISKWDVSNVISAKGMFISYPFSGDISGWNVSNMEYMVLMFYASEFNSDISKWNVSGVKDATNIFLESDFKGDISEWKFNQDFVVNDKTLIKAIERSYEIKNNCLASDLKKLISVDKSSKKQSL